MASFKVQCPSCEAMVPVRDEGLIGRKIDCPKCKYRILVEAPPEEEEQEEEKPAPKATKKTKPDSIKVQAGDKKGPPDKTKPDDKGKAASKARPGSGPDKEDEAPADDEAGKKGKKKAGPSMVAVGGALALGAVGALGLALYFVMGSANGSSKPRPVARVPTPPPAITPPKPAEVPAGPVTPAEPPVQPPAVADISNLLPNNAQAVVNVSVDLLLRSSAKPALLQTPGAFNPKSFQQTFGFPFEDVSRIVIAYGGSEPTKKYAFAVMRTSKPFNAEDLVARLRLSPEAPINSINYYQVRRDLDPLGNFLLKGNVRQTKIAVHIMDPQTLVVADFPAMQKFLEDNARPQAIAQPSSSDTPPAPMGTTPMGAPVPGQPMPRPPAGQPTGQPPAVPPPATGQPPPATPPMGQPPTAKPPTGQPPTGKPPTGQPPAGQPPVVAPTQQAGGNGSWLTVKTELKTILDKIDKPEAPAIIAVASEIPHALTFAPAFKELLEASKAGSDLEANFKLIEAALADSNSPLKGQTADFLFKGAGVSVNTFKEDRFSLTVALEAKSDEGLALLKQIQQQFTPVAAVANPSGPTPAGQPKPAPPPEVTAVPTLIDKLLLLHYDKSMRQDEYTRRLHDLEQWMVILRGESEMVNTRSFLFELAAATQAYVKANGQFPPGTVNKTEPDQLMPPPPERRLSWMVELLPYVANGEFKDLPINKTMAWNAGPNAILSRLVIPQFVSRGDKGDLPYRIKYPGTLQRFAATHFVGIAGIGMDAPYYQANNPAVAKKIGMFGYDRITKPEDVKDGLDKTILIMQVPLEHKAPWLAGGGSTVRGVAEELDCFKPFVCVEYNGKKGSFAIMADGKVRFLAATISPEIFRALCTINGGEKIDNLDLIAPELPEPIPAELKTTPAAPSKPDPKPAPPKGETPAKKEAAPKEPTSPPASQAKPAGK